QQDRKQLRIGRHARCDTHHEIILERTGIHAGLSVHVDATYDADIEALELRNRAGHLHDVEIILHFLDSIIEHHRRPGPGLVGLHLHITERAGIAGGDLRLRLPPAVERALIVQPRRARRMVDDYARTGLADRLLDFLADADFPGRQMPLARRLLAQVDVH